MGIPVLLWLLITPAVVCGQDISVRLEEGWVTASRGRDDTLLMVRVKIWGTTRITGEFHQLDADPEQEFVLVSRGTGTGPYYRLQIIDFRPNGIASWSYASSGMPRIENGHVLLGTLPDGYQGAATQPAYARYGLSVTGLSKVAP